MSGHHAPAAGSTMPYSGSIVPPGMPRLHWPSDSPITLMYRYASTSGTPVLAVGRSPTPRPGGLHQTWGSPVYLPGGGVQAPRPLRLVSVTKWVSSASGGWPAFWSNHRSVQCQVLGSVGDTELPGWPSLGAAPEKYWLAQKSVCPR